jgi:ribosome-binding protein aMBF1 (putative translation factor)
MTTGIDIHVGRKIAVNFNKIAVGRNCMRRIENFDRKMSGQALKQSERNSEQSKNRPHSENIDQQEEDRLNSKFEEIIDDCKKIRQILSEAKQAVSADTGLFFGGGAANKGEQ